MITKEHKRVFKSPILQGAISRAAHMARGGVEPVDLAKFIIQHGKYNLPVELVAQEIARRAGRLGD